MSNLNRSARVGIYFGVGMHGCGLHLLGCVIARVTRERVRIRQRIVSTFGYMTRYKVASVDTIRTAAPAVAVNDSGERDGASVFGE